MGPINYQVLEGEMEAPELNGNVMSSASFIISGIGGLFLLLLLLLRTVFEKIGSRFLKIHHELVYG